MWADLERVAGLAPEERFAMAPPFLAPDLLRVHLRPLAFLWEAATWIREASGEAAVAFAGATGAITEAAPKARTVTAVAKVFLSKPELLIDPRGKVRFGCDDNYQNNSKSLRQIFMLTFRQIERKLFLCWLSTPGFFGPLFPLMLDKARSSA